MSNYDEVFKIKVQKRFFQSLFFWIVKCIYHSLIDGKGNFQWLLSLTGVIKLYLSVLEDEGQKREVRFFSLVSFVKSERLCLDEVKHFEERKKLLNNLWKGFPQIFSLEVARKVKFLNRLYYLLSAKKVYKALLGLGLEGIDEEFFVLGIVGSDTKVERGGSPLSSRFLLLERSGFFSLRRITLFLIKNAQELLSHDSYLQGSLKHEIL